MPDIILIAICVGYALYNAIRKTLPIALPLLMHDLGISKSEVGQIASSFALAYGCSKFGSSVISDFVNCKKLFTIGLLCTSLTSLMFPFVGSSVIALSAVWSINGLVQGVGWPSVSKIIYLTYSPEQRGTAWSAASTAGNVGLILGSVLFPALLQWGWRTPFVLSGVLGMIVALVCSLTLPADKAQDKDIDIGTAEEISAKSAAAAGEREGEEGLWSSLQFLFSVPLCCLFLASMGSFFLQRGLSDWAGLFFIETYGWDTSTANSLVFVNEVGGVVGSLAAGVVSDWSLLDYRKDLTCLLFSSLLLPSYGLLVYTLALPLSLSLPLSVDSSADTRVLPSSASAPSMFFLATCLALVGVGASGPKTLLGLMVRNAVPLQRMGLAGGVLGFVGQLGGAAAGRGLGSLVELQGWGVFFPTLLGVSGVCSGVIAVFMWYEKKTNGVKSEVKTDDATQRRVGAHIGASEGERKKGPFDHKKTN